MISLLSSQSPNVFTSFSPKIFFWQFFSWNQICQQLISPKPQHFHEFSPKTIRQFSRKIKVEFLDKNWRFRTVCSSYSSYVYDIIRVKGMAISVDDIFYRLISSKDLKKTSAVDCPDSRHGIFACFLTGFLRIKKVINSIFSFQNDNFTRILYTYIRKWFLTQLTKVWRYSPQYLFMCA